MVIIRDMLACEVARRIRVAAKKQQGLITIIIEDAVAWRHVFFVIDILTWTYVDRRCCWIHIAKLYVSTSIENFYQWSKGSNVRLYHAILYMHISYQKFIMFSIDVPDE